MYKFFLFHNISLYSKDDIKDWNEEGCPRKTYWQFPLQRTGNLEEEETRMTPAW